MTQAHIDGVCGGDSGIDVAGGDIVGHRRGSCAVCAEIAALDLPPSDPRRLALSYRRGAAGGYAPYVVGSAGLS